MRGDVYRIEPGRAIQGHEQGGGRYAVIVQSDDLPLSTTLVAPTSTSARPADFRAEVTLLGTRTLILAEQTFAADSARFRDYVTHLTYDEMGRVDAALRTAFNLRA